MTRTVATIFACLFGLAFGSFLNVCLTRWPQGESVVSPRSHCRRCNHTLAWWENVPLLSWLALGGRCHNCNSRIGWRYPLVELAVGLLWALVVWRSQDAPFPIEFAAGMMLLMWILVALALLDAEHLWLPNALTLPGAALGFVWWLLQSGLMHGAPKTHHALRADAKAACMRVLAILASAALILFIRWIYWLLRRREGIGIGDAKLMALLAAWLGLPGALFAFGVAAILGSIAAVALLAVPSARRESESWAATKLPLGTFLCIGGIVGALWGQPIIAAYLRWAGI